MTFSKISLLVPTRGRVTRLQKMIRSYVDTCDGRHTELIFRIDADDRETVFFLDKSPYRVIIGPRWDGYRSLPLFFNEMAEAATGDILMSGNDDILFRTKEWDRVVLAEANKYPDGLFNLAVRTHNEQVVPWSIVSKSAVQKMGQLYPLDIYWGDVYLRDVMLAAGRVVFLDNVQIDHEWAGHVPDRTFIEAQQSEARNWSEEYWTLHRTRVAEAVERLKA